MHARTHKHTYILFTAVVGKKDVTFTIVYYIACIITSFITIMSLHYDVS